MSLRRFFHLVTALALAAGIGLMLDAVFSYRSYRQDSSPRPSSKSPARPPAPPVRPAPMDLAVIARRNLFSSMPLHSPGKQEPAGPRVPPAPSAKPPSPVRTISPPGARLRLMGTTVIPGGKSFAILEDMGSKRQKVYQQGERVDGAILQEVRRGEVHLVANGRVEILRIFQEETSTPSSPQAGTKGVPPVQGRPPSLQARQVSAPAPVPAPPGTGNGPPVVVQRSRLEAILKSPGELKRELRGERYVHPDGEAGVQVYPLKPSGVFSLLGLRSGDVVFSVDGTPAQSEESLIHGLSQLFAQGRMEAEIEILRSGKRQKLSFLFR